MLILEFLVGAGKIIIGREMVKKIKEGLVLRSRDGSGSKDSTTEVILGPSCTCDIGWIWKCGNRAQRRHDG